MKPLRGLPPRALLPPCYKYAHTNPMASNMPSQIIKADFPPVDQWEEMEIVENIDTPEEHADTFLRWNSYGIEIHPDGLCQAYVIINDSDGDEIPKMVSDGFSSPEAVIEYFRATEGQKALEGGAGAPAEGGEVPAEEPMPEGPDALIEAMSGGGDIKDEEPPAGEDGKEDKGDKKEDKEEGKEDDKGDKKEDEKKDKEDEDDDEKPVKKSLFKSWAEMRAEHEASLTDTNHPVAYCGKTVAMAKKEAEECRRDRSRRYPVDTIDHDPVVRPGSTSTVTHPSPHPLKKAQVVVGDRLPTWSEIRNGYTLGFGRNGIAKADPIEPSPGADEGAALTDDGLAGFGGTGDSGTGTATGVPAGGADPVLEPDAVSGDGLGGLADGDTPADAPIQDADLQQIANMLGLRMDELMRILSMDGGPEALAQAIQTGDVTALEQLIGSGEGAVPPASALGADDIGDAEEGSLEDAMVGGTLDEDALAEGMSEDEGSPGEGRIMLPADNTGNVG